MIEVYYENHLGEVIDLKKAPYRLITGNLFDYEWDNAGSSVFERFSKKKRLQMDIFTKKREYHRAVNHLHDVFERDVLSGIPGRLYFCESYIPCYIIMSEKSDWESDIFMTLDLTLLTNGAWITEKTFHFKTVDALASAAAEGGNYLKYPFNYPYNYQSDVILTYLENDGVGPCDFDMVIFGPCTNPKVHISDDVYEINVDLHESEYLIITSSPKRMIKHFADGSEENVMNARNKKYGIERIAPGTNIINRNGSFGVDITIYKERSVPLYGDDYNE